jgi:hypothetical protein
MFLVERKGTSTGIRHPSGWLDNVNVSKGSQRPSGWLDNVNANKGSQRWTHMRYSLKRYVITENHEYVYNTIITIITLF